jgi:hypothetical protein
MLPRHYGLAIPSSSQHATQAVCHASYAFCAHGRSYSGRPGWGIRERKLRVDHYSASYSVLQCCGMSFSKIWRWAVAHPVGPPMLVLPRLGNLLATHPSSICLHAYSSCKPLILLHVDHHDSPFPRSHLPTPLTLPNFTYNTSNRGRDYMSHLVFV